MDDISKQPHSMGSGAQRNAHSRPFFYVQPPSQPYYLYQHLQLNNPYSQYGLPGGFNFGRPYMHPYPYMPYPGFVLPHAPIYPMDYRRMFEPRFHTPAWGEMPRQQQHHPQPHGRREMACSEAQTDPSDAISKLIECLDKIRATELQSADRELDSGVVSQSSSVFSPGEEKKKEQDPSLASAPHSSCLGPPAVAYSDSTAMMYNSESSQIILDPLSPQGCWSGALEEELPLDSSSVHEECPKLEQSVSDEHFVPLKEDVTGIQSNISVTDSSVQRCDAEEPSQSLSFTSTQPVLHDSISRNEVPKGDLSSCDEDKADQSCQILKLPFNDVLTPGAGCLSSPTDPYHYNYLPMQTTQERMSVLSPSLDELSSRDEMFSTDLDDVDLFPKHVYSGRRLAEVFGGSPPAAGDVEEAWMPDSKGFMCACCGKSLAKGTSRSKVHSSKRYMDEGGDSEEDGRYRRGCEQPLRVVVRKHSSPRKTHPLPQRHVAKTWCKRGPYMDPSDRLEQEEHIVCKAEAAKSETGHLNDGELQCRTCHDGKDLTSEDMGRWGDGEVIPRRQAAALQRQAWSSQTGWHEFTESSPQWKLMYHGSREEKHDDEQPAPYWERGSAVRKEPQC